MDPRPGSVEPGAGSFPAGAQELQRELDRVADRLRVLGPRLAGRGDDAGLATVRRTLQELADLGAAAEDRVRRDVPVLGAHALADQVLVLGHDVLAAGSVESVSRAHDLLVALRRSL
ncbi:MAG: hypothetical protein P8Z68_08410 [Kineosporiaceae bacterium]